MRKADSVTSGHIPPGYKKVWGEDFSGPAINQDNWIVGLRAANGDLVPGASGDYLLNRQYAGYAAPDDAYIENGLLLLRNQKRSYTGTSPAGNYRYTSGWVMSMHKVFLNKGFIEVKARFPSGDKVWPALWLIAEDLTWGPEWDLFEYFGYRKDIGFDNMGCHLAYGESHSIGWESNWIRNFDSTYDCEAWHVYGFEWTAAAAIWYIDGVPVKRLAYSEVPTGKWPDENMYIVLNNGVRTESPDEKTVWPNFLVVDYIAIYQHE